MTAVGVIVPSSNTCVEPLLAQLLAGDPFDIHATRVRVTRIGLDDVAAAQFAAAEMLAAADLLADAGVSVLCWAGTAGSWLGVEGDRLLCRQITARTGLPGTTSTLAVLAALQELRVDRLGLAVPYAEEVGAAITSAYAAEGVECVTTACLSLTRNADFAGVPTHVIAGLVRAAAAGGVQAVAVICTNLPATAGVPALEAQVQLPVVDSIAATAWQVRRLLGATTPIAGWGALMDRVPSQH